MDKIKQHWAWCLIGLLAVIAALIWWALRPPGLPQGFAGSNGRIEATEVDIATKTAGRIDAILVKEGQFVRKGEVLARMDIRVLNEQRLEAAAQIKEAESAVAAAKALLDQRQSEMRATEAVVKQRQAELNSTAKRHVRSSALSQRGAVSAQQLDDDQGRQRKAPGQRSNPPEPRSQRQKRQLKPPVPALFRPRPALMPLRQPNGASSPILTIANSKRRATAAFSIASPNRARSWPPAAGC